MDCCNENSEMKCQECILTELLESINHPVIYVEVGVLRGECLIPVTQKTKNIIKGIGIDPYMPYVDVIHGNYGVGPAASKLNLSICLDGIKNSGVEDKIELILEDSHIAVNKFQDNSIDVVYLDKSFTVEETKQDINDWWPKIKKDGYLVGHEWDSVKVNKAIIEAATTLGIVENLTGEDNVWKIKKPF